MDKSRVTRLLRTCLDRGWIVRDPASRRYTIGPTLLAMARRGALDDRVMITVYEALTSVRDATGETAGFHRRAGARRVAITGVESRHDVRRGFNSGESFSLLSGPASKAILAFVPDSDRSSMLEAAQLSENEIERHAGFLRDRHYLSTDSDRTATMALL